MTQDWQWLRQYVENGSQEAFGALVDRYINLVFSTCRRELGDATLAEDATQEVFLLLARKAPTLHHDTILSGWLFQTARFVARNAQKQELRRQLREEKAAQEMIDEQQLPGQATWEELAPLLHDAVSGLAPEERSLVLLRYFENLSLKEVGARLNVSENAAQKRLTRAVDKLRRHFTKCGLFVSVGILLELISRNAVEAAPAGCRAATLQAVSLVANDTGATYDSISSLMPANHPAVGRTPFLATSRGAPWVAAGVAAIAIVSFVVWRSAPSAPNFNNNARATARQSGLRPSRATPKLAQLAPITSGKVQPMKVNMMNQIKLSATTARPSWPKQARIIAALAAVVPVAGPFQSANAQPPAQAPETGTLRPAVAPPANPAPSAPPGAAGEVVPRPKALPWHSLALSPDGRFAVSGRTNGELELWETQTGNTVRTFQGHTAIDFMNIDFGPNPVTLFSPDGKLLLTRGAEVSRLWSIPDGELLWTLPDNKNLGLHVDTAIFSPDSQVLVTKGVFYPPTLWDARTGKLLQTLKAPRLSLRSLAFSPDGRLLAAAGDRYDKVASTVVQAGEIVLWDITTGEMVRSISQSQSPLRETIAAVAFSPDGTQLATGGQLFRTEQTAKNSSQSSDERGEVKLWDVKSGVLLQSFSGRSAASVNRVLFTPDGKRLVAASSDDTVRLWDLEKSNIVAAVTRYGTESVEEQVETMIGPPGLERSVEFVEGTDRRTVARNSEIKILPPGAPGSTTIKYTTRTLKGRGIEGLALSPDGNTVVILSKDKSVRVWEIKEGGSIESDPVRRTLNVGWFVTQQTFAFAPNVQELVAVGHDNTLRMYDALRLQESRWFRPHQAMVDLIAFTPVVPNRLTWRTGDSALATVANDYEYNRILDSIDASEESNEVAQVTGFQLKLWDYESGTMVRAINSDGFGATALALSPDGRYVAVSGVFIGPEHKTVKVPAGARLNPAVMSWVNSDKSKYVRLMKGAVMVWDIRTGELKRKHEMPNASLGTVAFSPDSNLLVADWGTEGLKVWNTASGALLRTIDKPAPSKSAPDSTAPTKSKDALVGPTMCFLQNGTRIARLRGNKVQLFNVATGGLERTLISLKDEQEADFIVLSTDEKIIATEGDMAHLKLWDAQTGALLWTAPESLNADAVAFSAGGIFMATHSTGDFNSGTRLWDIRGVRSGNVY